MRLASAAATRTAPQAVSPWRKRRRAIEENAIAYLYLLPTMLILGSFSFYPVIKAFLISLTNWNPISPKYIGAANYVQLMKDPAFWASLWHTLYFTVATVPTSIALSLGVALLLNQQIRGRSFYRLAFFTPYITTVVAVTMVWSWIFQERFGLMNYLLELVHLPPQAWLNSPRWSMPILVVMSVWKTLGYNVVIFLAGLQNVDPELIAAAKVDGASPRQVFRHVTWPLLSPTTFFVTIISIIGAFKVFTEVFVLYGTTPGPLRSAETIVFFIYDQAFHGWHLGYAAAASYVLFAIIFVLTLIQLVVARNRVHYG